MKTITEERYREATENYEGWCVECQDFTRETTEPDAEGYDCPVCRERAVCGAEQALLLGLFEFAEEDADARPR